MHVKAFEAMMKTNSLPCNVKFIFEGEEEVGSKSLEAFYFRDMRLCYVRSHLVKFED